MINYLLNKVTLVSTPRQTRSSSWSFILNLNEWDSIYLCLILSSLRLSSTEMHGSLSILINKTKNEPPSTLGV